MISRRKCRTISTSVDVEIDLDDYGLVYADETSDNQSDSLVKQLKYHKHHLGFEEIEILEKAIEIWQRLELREGSL